MRFFAKPNSHTGYSLVELIFSIAIIGILTVILFSSFKNERQRNASKRAAEQLQIDIQASQNSAQSGLLITGTSTRPGGYGSSFDITSSAVWDRYVQFADATSGTIGLPGDAADVNLQTIRLQNGVILTRLCADSTTVQKLSIVFQLPNGTALINGQVGANPPVSATVGKIILRHPTVNQYYSVTISRASGTVSRRQTSTNACP